MLDRWEHLREDDPPNRRSITIFRNITQRAIAAVSVIFLGSLITAIGQQFIGATSPLIFVGISLGIFGILTVISASVILTLRIGTVVRELIERYWEKQTPPYSFHAGGLSWQGMKTIHRHLSAEETSKRISRPDVHFETAVLAFLYNAAYGTLISSTSLFIGVIIGGSIPGSDAEVGGTPAVSVAIAVISVLLGRVLGIAALGLATFADNMQEILVFGFTLGLPSVAIAPATRTLMDISESVHETAFSRMTWWAEICLRCIILGTYVSPLAAFVVMQL